MTAKAVALNDDRPVFGTPRHLPVVLMCHATVEWCESLWIANNEAQYNAFQSARYKHEKTCEAIQELRKTAPKQMSLYRG